MTPAINAAFASMSLIAVARFVLVDGIGGARGAGARDQVRGPFGRNGSHAPGEAFETTTSPTRRSAMGKTRESRPACLSQ